MLGGALAYRLFVFLLPLALFLVVGDRALRRHHGAELGRGRLPLGTDRADREGGLSGGDQPRRAGRSSSSRSPSSSTPPECSIGRSRSCTRSPGTVPAAGFGSRRRDSRPSAASSSRSSSAPRSSVGSATATEVSGVLALLVYGSSARRRLARIHEASSPPRRRLEALVPGAAAVGLGLLLLSSFNVYVTTWLVEDRADTYGALGVATALLFSLYLVGRVVVGSAVLNATLDARRRR